MGGKEITSGSFEENGVEDGARLELDVSSWEHLLAGRWDCHDRGSDGQYEWDTTSTLELMPDGRFESMLEDVPPLSHLSISS